MRVVRPFASVVSLALAVTLVAAGPRPQPPAPAPSATSASVLGARVLARADAADASAATATATPAPSVAPSPTAAPSAAPSAAPGPTPAPAISAGARAEFEAWQAGKIDLTHYIPEAKAQFTAEAVGQISSQYLHPLGAVKTFAYVRQMTVQGMTVYVYLATCANGALEELISYNADGKVQFIFFRPPA